ncbi:MAG: family N-acetyltransferase [Devosia sp.]|nr:family N-acetyltransferase [Devosia sp.]
MSLNIRPAIGTDAGAIVQFIADLATYENLSHEAKASEADILRDLFGADPKVFCEIAEWEGRPLGFALWCYT